MRTLIALFVGCLISSSTLGAVPHDAWREARIRPQDPRIVQLLRDGTARSETLRSLVTRIEAGNVFVYVTLSPVMKNTLAGKLTWMTRTGHFRYLRATLNTEQSTDQMIATLAHELQHVVEVSEDDNVTDQRSLQELYKRIGRPSLSGVNAGWETAAAQQTGHQVRRELIAATATASAARVGRDRTQS
jgi:hypothetical protein